MNRQDWEDVVTVNDAQKRRFTEMIISALFDTVQGKRIAILGLALKSDTNDVRGSPAGFICLRLLKEGAQVALFDPYVESRSFIEEFGDPGGQTVDRNRSRPAEHRVQ